MLEYHIKFYKGINMNKIILSMIATAALTTQMYAGGDITPIVEPQIHEEVEVLEAESPFYIIGKGMMILGDKVNHEESVLDGDQDFGFGIDLGYRIGNGFAIEYDFSYAKNDVLETREGHEAEEGRAEYYTSALALVYTYEATESLGIFGKVGYEYEWEKINKFDIDGHDDGFVFAGGIEVKMDESYKFVLEYEHSTIEGPKGDTVFAGVMFNF
jgi:opacity protein-like surface antigen